MITTMSQSTVADETITLHVENIGGITETSVELTPGVTVLTGRNATNRTSLLQAIMAALGSDRTSLKADADEGRVELILGDKAYTRQLKRRNGSVVTDGDPYLEDATLADLFAFLLENNDAQRAVARGDDLREVIMNPVDADEIEREIERLQSQRDEVDAQLEEINKLKQKLPEFEGERTEVEDEIEERRRALSDIEAEIDDIDQNVEEQRNEKQELEAKLDELNDVRSQLESIRHQIDSQQESLDALRNEEMELESDRESYEEIPDGRIEGIEAEIQRLRNKRENLNNTINEIQTVIEFNEDLLDGSLDIFSDIQDDDSDDSDITEQLLGESDEVLCWTCGRDTDTSQIETMLENLQALRDQYMEERSEITSDIDELKDERHKLKEKRRQRKQIDDKLDTVTNEIGRREEEVEELKEQRSDLTDQVKRLEEEVDRLQTESDRENELLELHKEANRLEVEIDRLESDLESVEDEIARIEDRADERADLESKRDKIQAEIEDLRTRIDQLEKEAIEQFNNHMVTLLDLLGYENLDRIWIERTEEQVRDGRQTVSKTRFDLHVVRSTESNTAYEDHVDNLSESEREVTGLVFALAGYLVHDVHDVAPFIILDSVESIDAPRIATLVDYFHDHAPYLIVALLEEDAQALDEKYQRIEEI